MLREIEYIARLFEGDLARIRPYCQVGRCRCVQDPPLSVHNIEVKVSGRERSQLECRTCVSDSESDSLVSGTLCRQVKSSIQLNPVKSSNKLKLGNGEVHGAREECKTCVFLAVSRSSRREAHGERTSPTFGGFFQSATLSCVETEDGEEEEAMIYKGASLLRAIGQLEGRIGKRGSSYKISQ